MKGIISSQKFNIDGTLKEIIIYERSTRYRPSHPNATKRGAISLHRFIAASALGKQLPKLAVVHHHYDGSLIICQDEKYHHLISERTKAFDITGDPSKRRCSYCKQWDDPINLRGIAGRGFHHLRCAAEYNRQLKERR